MKLIDHGRLSYLLGSVQRYLGLDRATNIRLLIRYMSIEDAGPEPCAYQASSDSESQ